MIIKINNNIVDAEPIKLNLLLELLEISNPEKRKTSKSKSIRLIGTDRTNQALGYQGNVNSLPQQGFEAEIIDGALSFKGILRINKINKLGRYTYDCNVFGNNYNWVQSNKGKSVNTLVWDKNRLSHDYTAANILSSEVVGVDSLIDYRYPLIDIGYFTDGDNRNEVNVIDRFPSVKLRPIIEKIIEQSGYEPVSTFFSSELFDNLYMPYFNAVNIRNNTEPLGLNYELDATTADLETQSIPSGTPTTVQLFASNTSDNKIVPYSKKIKDESDSYVTLTDKYKVKQDGAFRIKSDAYIRMDFISPAETVTIKIEAVSNLKGTFETKSKNVTCNGSYNDLILISDYLEFSENEEIWIKVTVSGTVTQSTGTAEDLEYRMREDSNFIILPTARRGVNYTWLDSEILPDIDRLKLLQSVIRMFNLMVLTDENEKKVYLEPRLDFFSGDILDWTSKVVKGSIKLMEKNINKVYSWQYRNDSNDKLAEARNKQLEYPYLSYQYESLNFNQDEEAVYINPLFAATHYVDSSRIGLTEYQLPSMWNFDQLLNITENNFNYELRLLYYDGVGSGLNGYVFDGGDVFSIPIFSNIDLNKFKFHKDSARTLDELYYLTLTVMLNDNEVNQYINAILNNDFRSPIEFKNEGIEGVYYLYALDWNNKTKSAQLILEKQITNSIDYNVAPIIL